MGFNKVILQGNLVEDISLRYTQSGTAIATSKIAVGKKFKKSDGSQGEKTLWLKFTMWARSAEIANQYLRKGSKVLLEGSLENEDYTDSQGVKKYGFNLNVESMTMLDSRTDNTPKDQPYQPPQPQHETIPQDNASQHVPQQQPQGQPQQPSYQPQQSIPEYDIDEDNIPFSPIGLQYPMILHCM